MNPSVPRGLFRRGRPQTQRSQRTAGMRVRVECRTMTGDLGSEFRVRSMSGHRRAVVERIPNARRPSFGTTDRR